MAKLVCKFMLDGVEVGSVVLKAKDYSGGSTGVYAQVRNMELFDDGETYSGSIMLYRDGSKNDPEAADRAAKVQAEQAERKAANDAVKRARDNAKMLKAK